MFAYEKVNLIVSISRHIKSEHFWVFAPVSCVVEVGHSGRSTHIGFAPDCVLGKALL